MWTPSKKWDTAEKSCVIDKKTLTLQSESGWWPPWGCPDGGIGRRVGLKHQWCEPCRFEPGSGHRRSGTISFRTFLLFYVGGLPFYGRSLGESCGLFISVLLSFHVRNLPVKPQNALKYGFIKLNTLNKCRNRTLSLKKYSLILDNRKISINFAPFLIAKNCFIILIY